MKSLLNALWPNTSLDGDITFTFLPSKKSVHMPLCLLPQMDDVAIAELKETYLGENAYFGLGLRKHGLTSYQVGGKKDVIAMPAIALDLDFEDLEAHKTKDPLPRNEEEAYSLIEHLPDPTAIVQTGHGWQIYWAFNKPHLLKDTSDRTQFQKAYKIWQKQIIERADGLGFHVDDTASIHRIWRLPGFANLKKGDVSNTAKILHLGIS